MQDYDEKRNYIRMSVDCELSYKLTDSSTFYTGTCTSISGHGWSDRIFWSDIDFHRVSRFE
jgi:hypothetical protein